jgi:solute carrier family 25 carnitine/acylcarnitine transporter 20/29
MIAGGVQSFICGPIELVKTQLQVSGVGKSSKQHKQKKEWQVARDIVKADGIRGLGRGMGLTIAREVPAFGAYFLGYEYFYKHGTNLFPDWQFTVTMFAGGMAGVCCWCASYPQDVIKTRMQADGVVGKPKYKNFIHCYNVTRLEGSLFNPYSAFWRGFGATAIRAFPVNAITFTVVDVMATNLIALNSQN